LGRLPHLSTLSFLNVKEQRLPRSTWLAAFQRFAIHCLPRRSLGEGGSTFNPTTNFGNRNLTPSYSRGTGISAFENTPFSLTSIKKF
jgi:hypothetical protein